MIEIKKSSNAESTSCTCTLSSPLYARIVSGSVGSILTSLLVTPLEVVKVRLQANAVEQLTEQQPQRGPQNLPSNVSLCRRGCGTFVLNNGQLDCLLPKSAVSFFDGKTGRLTETAKTSIVTSTTTTRNASNNLGTFSMLRRIFRREGFGGIYAGLRPTLVMAVPNTVLYFSAYDELVYRFKKASFSAGGDPSANWIPLVAGGSARLLASWVTAPFELLRTRQASLVGAGAAPQPQPNVGMVGEFRLLVAQDGYGALYQGLRPTLWRDVPFSAIYWLCLERLRLVWKQHSSTGMLAEISPWEQAVQEFVNGAVAGIIAACFTTPFDVVKTRQQQQQQQTLMEDILAATATHPRSASTTCAHDGAAVFYSGTTSSWCRQSSVSTFSSLQQIARTEGVSGLWRGNQARMLKVAPACAIMISSYELGKRILLEQ